MIEDGFSIIKWAWKKKEWRGHVISMAFSAFLALCGFAYFSAKHSEAMAGIRDTKESIFASITRIDRNVQDIYGYLIIKRMPPPQAPEN